MIALQAPDVRRGLEYIGTLPGDDRWTVSICFGMPLFTHPEHPPHTIKIIDGKETVTELTFNPDRIVALE